MKDLNPLVWWWKCATDADFKESERNRMLKKLECHVAFRQYEAAGRVLSDLEDVVPNIDAKLLRQARVGVVALRGMEVSVSRIREYGFSIIEMLEGGLSLWNLYVAGVKPREFREEGIAAEDLWLQGIPFLGAGYPRQEEERLLLWLSRR